MAKWVREWRSVAWWPRAGWRRWSIEPKRHWWIDVGGRRLSWRRTGQRRGPLQATQEYPERAHAWSNYSHGFKLTKWVQEFLHLSFNIVTIPVEGAGVEEIELEEEVDTVPTAEGIAESLQLLQPRRRSTRCIRWRVARDIRYQKSYQKLEEFEYRDDGRRERGLVEAKWKWESDNAGRLDADGELLFLE